MNTLEEDIQRLNFECLMMARDCARQNPQEAAWRFGLTMDQALILSRMPIVRLKQLAGSSRLLMRAIPTATPSHLSPGFHSMLLATDTPAQERTDA